MAETEEGKPLRVTEEVWPREDQGEADDISTVSSVLLVRRGCVLWKEAK